jgi:signal transduction histidine kinase
MGMGLSISRSIVEAHGGTIEYRVNASRHSTFRFTLPLK